MNLDFIGQNVHFAVNLLASLAMFAVFWLIFDAWLERKKLKETLRWLGFLLLALGFLANGSIIDQVELTSAGINQVLPFIANLLRVLGYALVVASQLADPLMKRPTYSDEFDTEPTAKTKKTSMMALVPATIAKFIVLPVLPLAAAVLYFRRATTGLERHLQPVAVGFALLTVFELLTAINSLQSTLNPLTYNFVQTYGPVWWLAQLMILAASITFGNWVWRYLTKRLLSQIFIVLVTTTVSIYFVSTVGFSYLLLGNTRAQALADLSTASHVLSYALTSNKLALQAQAEAASLRPGVAPAAAASDHKQALAAIGTFARDHHANSLIVTDADGKVLARSEDPERFGDSLSSNSLIQRSLIGRSVASVVVSQGVVAPAVALVSAQPIRNQQGQIVGTVKMTQAISSAFVDNVKAATGLDSTVYGNDQRSATTLKTADNLHRAVGIKETNQNIVQTVLKKGQAYNGEAQYQNRRYLAAYTPLLDADNNKVGMLLVAHPASQLLASATKSTELAFLTAVGLLVLSIGPVYLLARKIAGDVR